MIDRLTGSAEAVPIADKIAWTIVRALYANLIARDKVPKHLHFKRGTLFESALFSK